MIQTFATNQKPPIEVLPAHQMFTKHFSSRKDVVQKSTK